MGAGNGRIGQIKARDRHLWLISISVIVALTLTIITIYAPDLMGIPMAPSRAELSTYLSGLAVLICLFCLYVIQAHARLDRLRDELVEKEQEKTEVQRLLREVEERSNEHLKTKEALEREMAERKQAEERVVYLAYHDGLTDLPNRRLFEDRLGQELSRLRWRKRVMAVLFLDIDRFKQFNDHLGHHVGDALLVAFSERLKLCLRPGDTVARLGGDEFAILLTDLAREGDVSLIIQKILDSLIKPINVEGSDLSVTTSIGVSLSPKDGEDTSTLLKTADMAMYRAKEEGGNSFQYYDPVFQKQRSEWLSLESALRLALERQEFLLHYQPQVDLDSGRVVGVEALVRWRHPEKGLISPGKFIPLAEETGLIIPIGEWVLRTACAQAVVWRSGGFKDLRISVNLSPRQFRQKNLIETVGRVLKETGIEPRCVELELTESIMQNAETSVKALRRLKAMGLEISIDDFGMGYSSLSYLKRFPINTLKIDQAFIHHLTDDPDDPLIVTAIITLAHNLRLKAIAEGVETADQLKLLRLLRCDLIQGYYFSQPLPADEMSGLLAEDRRLS
ncbi:MAG TPA: EAL domain-containing protein [Nitrospiria bacterium]|jgi:diguanylate cyclase (GGDEF)-like protein|nr:EAL domain-containing protein [Nitrospiria bacterium]